MTSHIVLQPRIVTQYISPPSTLKYANTVTIGISGQIEKHCPVLAGNSLQGSAASCRTHGLTMQQKERRVSTSYLGKNKLLIPPVCCLRQNSCSVLCAPLPVSKLPISCRHPPHLQVTPPTCSHTVTDRDNPRILQISLKTKLLRLL